MKRVKEWWSENNYRLKQTFKSDPVLCKYCRHNNGCIRYRIAKLFRIGNLFLADCYEDGEIETSIKRCNVCIETLNCDRADENEGK